MNDDFPPLRNDLLLRAARGEHIDRAPVWVMRQAGRYLPEFRKVREDHEFFEVCRTPELATEVTLQPIRRYTGLVDAAIIFCDILVIPQALGMEVLMNPGPTFTSPLETPADVAKLSEKVDVDEELGYVFEALRMTRQKLEGQVPLIGFCGAPWTLMAYMIEGGASKTLQKSKTWLFKYPEESRALLKRISGICVDFLVGQVKAGAQLLQVFDSNAGDLSPHDFETFSAPTLRQISAAARCGYDTVGLDWTEDPRDVVATLDVDACLQGNLDPVVLYGGRDAIEREVKRMCEAFRSARGGVTRGWIANLGHGITPGVDPEDLRWFFECVHKYSTNL
ncbi:hypothetical protein PISMIDRAFT_308768 [Pisolithus microcarpus 441]|uniref:Uroporphyrinogen decarboxylase n=1 Tax=Pisolithus microcarpus 441 TaxID=765257 RepID=A0A0D0AF32_9AGAM|nr:hypothetical protein PISMIDRAFT_308768 [Pisolithus microcarpus 441]